MLPFDGDFARKKTKAAGLVRKAPNNRYRPPRSHPRPARGVLPRERPPPAPVPGRRRAPAASLEEEARPQPRPAGPARAVAIFLRAAPPRPLA